MAKQQELMAPPPPPPSQAQFKVDGVAYLCQRFNLLAAEFELAPEQLPLFYGAARSASQRGWLVVRRLFGIWEMQPSPTTDMHDLRVWPREELRLALGLTRPQMQAELDAVRGAWKGVQASLTPAEPPAKKELREVFEFSDDELLTKHGFAIRYQNSDERAWFAQRVRDYEKVLNEKFASVLARNALMNELRIYQIDGILNDPEKSKAGGTEWKNLLKVRQELDSNYQDQITQIKELCPWAGAIAGKFTFTGQLSDVTKGIQEFSGRGDTRLIDGIFTATELQIECRRSQQAPEPRYRAGLVVYLNAAKAGLWDPNWKSPFPAALLRCIDGGWRGGFASVADAEGMPVPDIEVDGPGGEYPPIYAPEEGRAEGELRSPKAEVRMKSDEP